MTGKEQHILSRRRAIMIGGGLLVAGLLPAIAHEGPHPATAPAPREDLLSGRFGGAFRLTRQDGVTVSDRDFLGKHLLVYFGFTRCADTCAIDMPMLATALDRLGPLADRVNPVFVSVDPEDGPQAVREYLQGLHPRFVGLTGTEPELAAIARAYRVHRRKLAVPPESGRGTHGQHNAVYTIDHGSLTYLMGPDGRFLTLFPHATSADRYTEVLLKYLAPRP